MTLCEFILTDGATFDCELATIPRIGEQIQLDGFHPTITTPSVFLIENVRHRLWRERGVDRNIERIEVKIFVRRVL